jgi:hypothetical protein
MGESNSDDEHRGEAKFSRMRKRWMLILAIVLACFIFVVGLTPQGRSTVAQILKSKIPPLAIASQDNNGESQVTILPPRTLSSAGISRSESDDLGSQRAEKKSGKEICRFGLQPVDDDGNLNLEKFITPTAGVLAGVAEKYVASGDQTKHLVGLYTKVVAAGMGAREEIFAQYPGCSDDADCLSKAVGAQEIAASKASESLALQAITTRDANLYAVAFYQCQERKSPACDAITGERWLTIDAENAVPWLFVAQAAGKRKDEIAAGAALKRASELAKYDKRIPKLDLILQDSAVRSLPLLEQAEIANLLVGSYLSAETALSYGNVFQYCKFAQQGASDRRNVCDKLGNLMVERDSTLLAFAIGTSIGEKAGWPQERLDKLKAERLAYSQTAQNQFLDTNMVSCDGAIAQREWIANIIEFGELAALRGKSRAQKSDAEKSFDNIK